MAPTLHLFGRPRVQDESRVLDLPFERRHQVLVYLALKRAWAGRAELAAMLWPEHPARLASANLRKTLFRLQSLPWPARVQAEGDAVRFEMETDVARFEAALRDGNTPLALTLGGAQLLAGFEDDASESWTAWLDFERERLRCAWRDAALGYLGGEIAADEAIALARRMLQADPIDEDALRMCMQWLARGGQVAAARSAYREFVQRLHEEFGLAPGLEVKSLHDALGAAQAGAGTVEIALHKPIPDADADFVGRTADLQRIAELLARPDARLLCVTGPGGIGKTRLARRAMRDFPGGTGAGAFVAFEDVHAAEEIAARIARAMGLVLAGTTDPLEAVVRHLGDRETLLVLDNFEQVEGGAPVLQHLLRSCPGVRLLVTTRVRLGAPGEWLLQLEGLACPDPEDGDRLDAFDAARLFLAAARRVQPDFSAAAESAAIVEICRQVDGLPLALEIAAAWTRVLPCDAIAAELRQGTELLRATDPSRPARHASMEVVFEQGWSLLSPGEREVFARLSVFRGGFTAEAAAKIAGASLPVLGSLADKSLLRKERGRIYQHPLLHQLAASRLDAQALASARAAHARYFLALMAQLGRDVEHGQGDALKRIETEFDNCRAAWHWAASQHEEQPLMHAVDALRHFCELRGRQAEGLALIREALGDDSARRGHELASLLLANAAELEFRMERFPAAVASATQALALARGSRRGAVPLAYKVLGACDSAQSRYEQARRHYDLALKHNDANTHPRFTAVMLDNLGLVEKRAGRLTEALAMSMQALEQFRRLGDSAGESRCLMNIAALHRLRGDPHSAMLHLKPALALCERHGLASIRGYVLGTLAEVSLELGDAASAQAYASDGIRGAQALGQRSIESWFRLIRVRLHSRGKALPAAREELCAAIDLTARLGRPVAHLDAVICFGELLAAQGEPQAALRVMRWVESQMPSYRDEIGPILSFWRLPDLPVDLPTLPLEELVHRIVAEAPQAHARLIAQLRAG